MPYGLTLAATLGVPFVWMLWLSVAEGSAPFANYLRIVSEPAYRTVITTTLNLAVVVTLATLVLGLPVALVVGWASPAWRTFLLLAITVPFWTSILVRAYAWLVLLQTRGLLNFVATLGHTVGEPVQMVHNYWGAVVGMVYALLPLMILSLAASVSRIDRTIMSAARTLGASRAEVFRRVVLPLAGPGIWTGCLLVFVLATGYFITPAILGGLAEKTLGMLIDEQMNRTLDWGFGSALAITLSAAVVAILWLATRFAKSSALGATFGVK